jgi:sarcosine oxidase subunit beta
MANTADVVIVGGGVMGCGMAYYLAKGGLKPVVIEKSDIGGEASGANGGGVRQSARNLKEIPLAIESVRMYGELHEELGMDVEYVRKGNLRLCTSEEEVTAMRKSVENQKAIGLELEMVDRKQILELNPYIGEKVIGASYCPSDGHVNPFLVTYGYFKRAKERGARFLTQEEVTGISVKKGRVAGVTTNKQTIETDLVVDAAGVGGRKIANMVGLDIPMQPVFSEALITESYPPLFPQMFGHAKGLFYGRQTVHGPFFWGGFVGTEQYIYRQGKPLFHYISPAISRMVVEYFPVLKDLNVIRVWSGLIAGMSDGIPVLGLTEEVPGFVFCTGFSGHGFGLAPVISRVMSELIMDCQVSIPIYDFCFGRFQKGKDHECTCSGNATCMLNTTICPRKREFVKNV